MLEIDGSYGEGGGQILRTSLALSAITNTPFRIVNIRANRSRPGLRRQHLAAVQAAAEVSRAELKGAELNSRDLTFRPHAIQAGNYHFSIGTSGSSTLVLQTVLPMLIQADKASTVVVEGGTHNPHAPPFDFLQKTFFPLLEQIGFEIQTQLERPGFFPAGGGRIHIAIAPLQNPTRLYLEERGPIHAIRARAVVNNLPRHIAQREIHVISQQLGLKAARQEIVESNSAAGPGNVVFIEVESEHLTEVFTGFGQRGIPAEKVASQAVREAQTYLSAQVPVGHHLTDQLLVPLSLAAGGSYLTLKPTKHTTTNREIIRRFLDRDIIFYDREDQRTLIEVASS